MKIITSYTVMLALHYGIRTVLSTFGVMFALCCGMTMVSRAYLRKIGTRWVLDRYSHICVIKHKGTVPKYSENVMPWSEFTQELERYVQNPMAYRRETNKLRKQAEERLERERDAE